MKYLSKITKIFAVLVAFTIGQAKAGVMLSNVGNDLLIEIENPITFDVFKDVSTDRLGFKLLGAIDVSGTGGFPLTSSPATEPVLSGSTFSSGSPDVALLRGGPDLEILYFLSGTVSLSIGDQVTLSIGELLLPNFFDYSIINGLNYTFASEMVLSMTSGVPISEPTSVTVPEPGSLFLFLFAIALFIAKTESHTYRRNV